MHELALIEELCLLAADSAAQQGATTIHSLQVRIGDRAGVDAAALQMAFAVLAQHPRWSSTKLELEVVTTRCFCPHCKQAFTPMDVIHLCPQCGSLSTHLLQGRELELVSMEVS